MVIELAERNEQGYLRERDKIMDSSEWGCTKPLHTLWFKQTQAKNNGWRTYRYGYCKHHSETEFIELGRGCDSIVFGVAHGKTLPQGYECIMNTDIPDDGVIRVWTNLVGWGLRFRYLGMGVVHIELCPMSKTQK